MPCQRGATQGTSVCVLLIQRRASRNRLVPAKASDAANKDQHSTAEAAPATCEKRVLTGLLRDVGLGRLLSGGLCCRHISLHALQQALHSRLALVSCRCRRCLLPFLRLHLWLLLLLLLLLGLLAFLRRRRLLLLDLCCCGCRACCACCGRCLHRVQLSGRLGRHTRSYICTGQSGMTSDARRSLAAWLRVPNGSRSLS